MLRTYVIGVLTVACLLLSGCHEIDEKVAALDAAISGLESESANWRAVIAKFGDKLPQQAQAMIAQIEEAGQTMIATAGVEARCNTDFLGRRLKEELQRIRNKIEWRYTVPTPQPVICHIIPLSITLAADGKLQLPGNARVVNFFGYNFDSSTVRLHLVNQAGASTDITADCLNVATSYQMVLNVGTNACGPILEQKDSQWHHIALTGFFPENQTLTHIAIVYLPAPPCQVSSNPGSVPETTIELLPPHRGGDTDFGLAEVSYTVTFRLLQEKHRVRYKLTMKAEGLPYEAFGGKFETDRTTFKGERVGELKNVPENYEIRKISASTETYTVTRTTKLSEIITKPGGLLKEVKIGIQHPIAGNDTDNVKVRVILNQFTITVAEDPKKVNCQP